MPKFCSVSPLLQRFAASLRSLAASFEAVYGGMIFTIDLSIIDNAAGDGAQVHLEMGVVKAGTRTDLDIVIEQT